GLCVKICPVKNISFKEEYPILSGRKCQLCMRCISYCPEHAIKSFFKQKKYYRALSAEEIKKWFL
ncbi:MAG: 4Fe-4S binding protein, partial [Endomicrobium sp.]|nr:4Fe-4S binding protein [Endomicrobium sp.]